MEELIKRLERVIQTGAPDKNGMHPISAEVVAQPTISKIEKVGDTISRQAAITQLSHNKNKGDDEWELAVENDIQTIWKLPSAHPEIIRCRECKFASGDSRICMKFDHSPIGELDFCAWAERRTDEE